MPAVPSAIPVGSQFGPGLIDLPTFVSALVKHSGDKAAMEGQFGDRRFARSRSINRPLDGVDLYLWKQRSNTDYWTTAIGRRGFVVIWWICLLMSSMSYLPGT